MSKPINKSGKRKVVKVGRDGRKRAYWVGTSQKPGGRLRNEGAPGEHKTFLQKHGKKIAAGVAGAAAIGLGLAARHHLKSEAGQRQLQSMRDKAHEFDAKHGHKAGYQLAVGAAQGVHQSLREHVAAVKAIGHHVVEDAKFVRGLNEGAKRVWGKQHSHPSHHSTPTHSATPVHRETHDTHSFEGNGRRFGGSQWGAR